MYSEVYLTLSTFRNLYQNHYFSLEIVLIQLLELKNIPLEDRICMHFRGCRWSQQQSFTTGIFHMNIVWLCSQMHLFYSFLGNHTFLRIILILFRRGKNSSVHKSPPHWIQSCIFKLYFHSLGLINRPCDNVGLFVIQAHSSITSKSFEI